MKASTAVGGTTGNTRVVLSALTSFLVFCMIFSSVAFATTVIEDAPAEVNAELKAILKKNKRCLMCHTKDKVKTLEDGKEMSLQIHREDFTGSAHGEVACVSCHEAIGNRKHPSKKTNITISSQREYSLELNQSCRNCHDKKFAQYEGSIHSSMVGQGSTKAPLCTDCHSAHAVETMTVYQPETGLPCKKCHENIFTAYSASVHGSARINGNVIRDEHIQAPICSDCHSSHEVVAMEIGDTLRSQCFDCHENVPLLHSQWLPNAGAHLDIVSCAVCHSPFAKHRFDLHFYDNTTQAPVGQQESHDLFQQQVEELKANGGTVDPLAVWKLIEESNESMPSNISLRGRLEVQSGIWAHQIAPKSFAVRTCDSCHLAGHRERMGVTVSVTQQDGRVQQFETDRENLGSVGAVETISDFFAIRGDSNKLLDIMVLLSVLAGFAIPIGHFTLGKMIKEKMQKGEG
jgi:hypothetical protein